jgi:hypothetical protein
VLIDNGLVTLPLMPAATARLLKRGKQIIDAQVTHHRFFVSERVELLWGVFRYLFHNFYTAYREI